MLGKDMEIYTQLENTNHALPNIHYYYRDYPSTYLVRIHSISIPYLPPISIYLPQIYPYFSIFFHWPMTKGDLSRLHDERSHTAHRAKVEITIHPHSIVHHPVHPIPIIAVEASSSPSSSPISSTCLAVDSSTYSPDFPRDPPRQIRRLPFPRSFSFFPFSSRWSRLPSIF